MNVSDKVQGVIIMRPNMVMVGAVVIIPYRIEESLTRATTAIQVIKLCSLISLRNIINAKKYGTFSASN
jgi:hypothetical protein